MVSRRIPQAETSYHAGQASRWRHRQQVRLKPSPRIGGRPRIIVEIPTLRCLESPRYRRPFGASSLRRCRAFVELSSPSCCSVVAAPSPLRQRRPSSHEAQSPFAAPPTLASAGLRSIFARPTLPAEDARPSSPADDARPSPPRSTRPLRSCRLPCPQPALTILSDSTTPPNASKRQYSP